MLVMRIGARVGQCLRRPGDCLDILILVGVFSVFFEMKNIDSVLVQTEMQVDKKAIIKTRITEPIDLYS